MNSKNIEGGPLSKICVLDMTQFLAGPYATQILGDLGAEIIKVEPLQGDMTRNLPPHFVGKESAYYLASNRNKRSIALDLKQEKGRSLVQKLALSCDVLVENFRPGVISRLGLDYEMLSAQKPSLIWCSISGFGQDGPYRDRPAYDMIVQAMSGGMSLTGDPQGRSVRSGIPLGDISAGMYGVIGILAALQQRHVSGRGSFIDISMLDCQIAMLSYQAAYYLASGTVPNRQGTGHDSIPTYRTFKCGDDRDIVVTANTERMWRDLCVLLGVEALVDDLRFTTNDDRYKNRHSLAPILESAFLERPVAEWVTLLLGANIPAAEVNTLDKSLSDPQVLYRDMVMQLEGSNGEELRVAGNPIKLNGKDRGPRRYPPALGENSLDILTRVLDLDAEACERLAAEGVVAIPIGSANA